MVASKKNSVGVIRRSDYLGEIIIVTEGRFFQLGPRDDDDVGVEKMAERKEKLTVNCIIV